MSREKVNVFWFRRDLRLSDNRGLFHALSEQHPVLPLFLFDTDILNDLNDDSDPRVNFIYDSLLAIHKQLKTIGSALHVYHGKPLDIFRKLTTDHAIEKVFANKDYEPYAKKRDREVTEFLRSQNIGFSTYKDHVIFEGLEIAREDFSPYRVYTPYKKRWLQTLKNADLEEIPSSKHLSHFVKTYRQHFPSLKDLGFKRSNIQVPEAEIDENIIRSYDKTRNYPAEPGTSKLGVHLRHGTLSVRKAVKTGKYLNQAWLQELIWREFYIMILDNFPHVVNEEFKAVYRNVPWRHDEELFEVWCAGRTGFPIVDAGMRELNTTGFMHNRVRMITASFLTKHLLLNWRWGEAYFGEKLLDYELASNNGGWQWAAGCGTDAQPYFRMFNPSEQSKKFDPDSTYIKKWIPELNSKSYPDPIIDHKFARQRAIETFKKALANQ